MTRNFRRTGCAGALLLMVAMTQYPIIAGAQDYPTRPIRLIVPWAVGGAIDATARPLGQKMNEALGKSVIIDNRAGASGMIGADVVAKAAPDGYTLLLSASQEVSMNTVVHRKMPYDVVRDFDAITEVAVCPLVLLVHPSLPVRSVQDLIALARGKPDALSYASVGIGTPHHFAGELLKSMARIEIVHVPYKGGGPARTDLLGGQVPAGFVALLSATPDIKSGKLRALAVTSLRRAVALPDVPTMTESGLPGFDMGIWMALWAPAKTPREIVDKLNREVVKIVQSADFRRRMVEYGCEAASSTPEELRRLQTTEIEKYRKIAAAAGVKAE